MAVVVTAIFGGYERPKAPPPGDHRCLLYTDELTIDDRWETRIAEQGANLHPRRRIFLFKQIPHVTVTDNPDVLWIDGSMEPLGKDLKSLFALVPYGSVGLFRHPYRDCYREEAEFSWKRYGPDGDGPRDGAERARLVREQGVHYLANGCPLKGGLWATGVIVWRGAQRRLGERWFAETMAWSASDQVSLPYVLHACGYNLVTLPGSVYDNPWFGYVAHGGQGRTTR